ncbi:hypothetical protein [Celeribacter baekdonensis]|nr:hypothetical protein [Celeribacter baekdonensis]
MHLSNFGDIACHTLIIESLTQGLKMGVPRDCERAIAVEIRAFALAGGIN